MPIQEDLEFKHSILDHFQKLKTNRSFSDVILRTGAHTIHAHRIIVTKLSDYFTLLFKYGGLLVTTDVTFDANIITGESLESIVDYAYSGNVDISEENVVDLMFSADYFNIESVKYQCEKFLTKSQKKNHTILTIENLPRFIWIACHLDLFNLRRYVCKFISNHFFDVSQIIISLSGHCFKTILEDEELTVCENGIPIKEIDLELLKLVLEYISDNNLPNYIVTELLGMIHLTEIQPEKLSSMFESFPRIRHDEVLSQVALMREMPLNAVVNDNYTSRKFSNLWKYVEGGFSEIDIDDKVCSIKVYHLKIMIGSKFESDENSRITPLSIVGLKLTYTSGIVASFGNTSGNPVVPFDHVICEQFVLSDKEFITSIEILTQSGESEEPFAIKFGTNLSNLCSSAFIDDYRFRSYLSPKSQCGYFHSIKYTSTIDNIIPLWVEYRDPNDSDDEFVDSSLYSSFDSDGDFYDRSTL